MKKFYAHSTDSKDTTDWQLLEEHLVGVADLGQRFASVFRAGAWGKCAGILHDAGKASHAFQERLRGASQRVDHSTFSARVAWQKFGPLGLLLAYAIAGHHGGLPNGGEQRGQLHFRLKYGDIPEDASLLPELTCTEKLQLPFRLSRAPAQRPGFALSFFTRMIFSCLVDSDFLDTEQFCSPERGNSRISWKPQTILPKLRDVFQQYMKNLALTAEKTPVNRIRGSIFWQCMAKAALPRQFFSLTVPTGGGKTLTSLGFALEHGCHHRMERIIYAIPFTSIIEQNAQVFRRIFGREVVLEHHTGFLEKNDREDGTENSLSLRLATENWEMPLVVTTNVQFFESLFACRTSRCRKLHNIAGSVIILDEAQAVPTRFLKPCLLALRELVEHYGCTVIFCTATQPALDDFHSLSGDAIDSITELVDDPEHLFTQLKRVSVTFIGSKSNKELADLLARERQVLCIVATKPQARTIFEDLQAGGDVFHLSTNMYPLHRQRVLNKIRDRLREGKPCRVISTSLVEAGVDLDFPVVYRAMAGLDSIAQAAGRCNREGKLNEQGKLGQVFIFESEKPPRMPWLKRCMSRAEETLRSLPDKDPLGREPIRRYFELLYDVQELDEKGILPLLNPSPIDNELIFLFREAAGLFKFIEEDTVDIIIQHEPEVGPLIRQLRHGGFSRTTFRNLQPYTVSVRRNALEMLIVDGGVEVIQEGKKCFYILSNNDAYSQEVGLCVDKAGTWDAENLVI